MTIDDIDSRYHIENAPFSYNEEFNDEYLFRIDDLLQYELDAVNVLIENALDSSLPAIRQKVKEDIEKADLSPHRGEAHYNGLRNFAYTSADDTYPWNDPDYVYESEVDKKLTPPPPKGTVCIGIWHGWDEGSGGSEKWKDGAQWQYFVNDEQIPEHTYDDDDITADDFFYKVVDNSVDPPVEVPTKLTMEDFWKSVGNRDSIKTWEDFFTAWRNFLEGSVMKSYSIEVYRYRFNNWPEGLNADIIRQAGGGDWGLQDTRINAEIILNGEPSGFYVTHSEEEDGSTDVHHFYVYTNPEEHPELFEVSKTIPVDISDLLDNVDFGSVPLDTPLDLTDSGVSPPNYTKFLQSGNYYIDIVKEDMFAAWGMEVAYNPSTDEPYAKNKADWTEVINKVSELTGGTDPDKIMEDIVKSSWLGFNSFLHSKMEAGALYGIDPTTGTKTTDVDLTKVQGLYAEFCKTTTHIETDAVFTEADFSPFYPGSEERIQFASFETAFLAFNPDATHDDFVNELAQVILIQLNRGEYFIPTHLYEGWIDHLKAPTMGAVSPFFEKDVTDMRMKQAQILNDVFTILIEMIGVIERAATSQAQRLKFFGEWQQQFTDLLKEVKSVHGMDNAQQINLRISEARETLRSYRDIIGDEVKQQQQTVNQLHDAASQQANIASSILQQLEGILTLIFR